MGFDKCIVSCIHHYCTTDISSSSLNQILCTSLYHTLLPPWTPGNYCFVFPPYTFAFSRSHINRIIEYVAFSMFFFLEVSFKINLYFMWIYSLLFLFVNSIPLYGCIIVCLSIHLLKDSWLFPVWGNQKAANINFLCSGFCVNICFQCPWVNT